MIDVSIRKFGDQTVQERIDVSMAARQLAMSYWEQYTPAISL